MAEYRSEFTTRFDGAPMQIEVGLENALSRLNGHPIKDVRVRLIGLGNAVATSDTGFVPFTSDVNRREFYKSCEARAHQLYYQESGESGDVR